MNIQIPIDAEIRRLAHDDIQTCSFCDIQAAIVAKEFDENNVNTKNTYFCWNHWGFYLNQEFPKYIVKNEPTNTISEAEDADKPEYF